MRELKSLCTIALMLLTLPVALRAQYVSEDQFLDDTLFGYYLGIVEKALYHNGKGADYYSIDPITHDTLYAELYLNKAVKYLEAKTNIYMPRSKLGGGFILNEQVFEKWRQYHRVMVSSTQQRR